MGAILPGKERWKLDVISLNGKGVQLYPVALGVFGHESQNFLLKSITIHEP